MFFKNANNPGDFYRVYPVTYSVEPSFLGGSVVGMPRVRAWTRASAEL